MDSQQDQLWIDRQEYERLKRLEAETAVIQPASSVIGSVTGEPLEEKDNSLSALTITTGIFAVLSFVYPPAVIVFLGLGITSLVKFLRGKARRAPGEKRSTKFKVSMVIVAIVAIFVLISIAPFLLFFAFMVFWQIGCWTGLGSCTTA